MNQVGIHIVWSRHGECTMLVWGASTKTRKREMFRTFGKRCDGSRFVLVFVVFVDSGLFPLFNMFPVGNVFDI